MGTTACNCMYLLYEYTTVGMTTYLSFSLTRKVVISQVILLEERIEICSLSSARVSSENYAK